MPNMSQLAPSKIEGVVVVALQNRIQSPTRQAATTIGNKSS